jgi:hypothetical protein
MSEGIGSTGRYGIAGRQFQANTTASKPANMARRRRARGDLALNRFIRQSSQIFGVVRQLKKLLEASRDDGANGRQTDGFLVLAAVRKKVAHSK